nr:CRISPR-associated endoribonuclease Cas6 [Fretibacterium sp.]
QNVLIALMTCFHLTRKSLNSSVSLVDQTVGGISSLSVRVHYIDYSPVIDGRRMKLFAMSWPIAAGKPVFEDKVIRFPLPVRLVVSSPVSGTMDGIMGGALDSETLRIGNNSVRCSYIEAAAQRVEGNRVMVRTLSPITCYSQAERNGRPFTVYHEPDQQEFEDGISNNLVLKFRALYPEREVPRGNVHITALGDVYERISRFNENSKFPIKGWAGRFSLDGPQELLQIAVDCGLGAKNSAGWGCVVMER